MVSDGPALEVHLDAEPHFNAVASRAAVDSLRDQVRIDRLEREPVPELTAHDGACERLTVHGGGLELKALEAAHR